MDPCNVHGGLIIRISFHQLESPQLTVRPTMICLKLVHPTHERPAGGPRQRRIRTEDIGFSRKIVTRGRCHKQYGHKAYSCREPLEE
ncbi:hypothetical protein V1519DRAFT_89555 [Lipomyces tetrasporus]